MKTLIKPSESVLSSMRTRVALLMGVGGLVFGLILTAVMEFKIESNSLAAAGLARAVAAEHVAGRLAADIRDREQEIQFAAAVIESQSGADPAAVRVMLDRLARDRPQYAWIGVTDTRGVVTAASSGLLEGRDVSQRPWFDGARNGVYLGDIHEATLLARALPPAADGGPKRFVDIALPLHAADGRFVGVMASHLHAYWIDEAVDEAIREMPDAGELEIFVVNRDGQLLYTPGHVVAARLDDLSSGAGAYVTTSPEPVAAVAGVDLGWRVVARERRSAIEAPIRTVRNQMIGLTLMVSVLFIWLSWLVAGRVTHTTRQLAQDALNYTPDTGMPFQSDVISSEDEAGVLAKVIGVLVDRMRLHADRFALFIEHAPVPLAIFDTEMRYVAVSQRWVSDYGLGDLELVGHSHYEIFPEIPERWRALHRRALAGEVLAERRESFVRSDGSEQWLHWIIRPWYAPDGSIGGVAIFTEDVTASVLAERALKKSESRFRSTFEQAAVGIAHVALDGAWLRVNDKLCQIVGYPRETLLAKTFQDITHAEDLETDLEYLQRLLAGDIDQYQMEKRYVRASGELVWINLTVSLVRQADGSPDYFVSVVEDIHARKLAEAALQAQEQMLSDMSEMAAVGGWSIDPATRHGDWTPECARIFGLPATAPLDMAGWCERVATAFHDTLCASLDAACSRGEPFDHEVQIITANGEAKWVRIIAHAWMAQGRVMRVFGACQDISEQRETADAMADYQVRLEAEVEYQTRELTARTRELTAARNYFREFVLRAPLPLCIVDTAGRIAVRNEQFLRVFGYDEASVPTLDKWWIKAYPDDAYRAWVLESWNDNVARADAEQRAIAPVEYRVTCADGSVRMMEISGVTLDSGFLATFVDVTERRRAQVEAERANQAKSDFLATMSHEIRTPMNAIIGISQLLERSEIPAESRARVGALRQAVKNLLALINDVLDLSKIESGHLEINPVPFSLVRLIDNMVSIFTPTASDKDVALSLAAMPADVDMLIGDAFRIEQVLYNLVGNAIKFTAQGAVTVRVQVQAGTDDPLTLRFCVRDTGIGIPQDKLDGLFKAFSQVDASTSRQYGGTGLGLAICRQLVMLMGGRIEVDSVPGAGSEFWFELPLRRAATHETGAGVAPIGALPGGGLRLNGIRILVADDSSVNLDVARNLLELEGALCETVLSGQLALDCLQAKPDAFDLVLMDIQMPDMDGMEATRRVREVLGLTALPVIALTAGALSSQRDRALQAGMTDFMSKPFELDALVAMVLRHCQPLRADAATPRVGLVPGGASTVFPAVPGVDMDQAQRVMMGRVDLFYRALRNLRDEFGRAAETLRQMRHAQEDRAASMMVHKLRGIAGSVGAQQVAEAAAAIETCLRQDKPVPGLMIDELEQALGRVLSGLPPDIDQAAVVVQDDAQIEPEEIRELADALAGNSMSAFDIFATLRARLAFHHPDHFEALEAAMEDFEFKVAVARLNALYPDA